MKSKVPDYYEEFHCIASECKHSCCIGWEIDVDIQTYRNYCNMNFRKKWKLKCLNQSNRYLIEAVFDGNFYGYAKFCVLCYLIIRDMDRMRFLIKGQTYHLEDRIETARIFSRQVEHSMKSMDYLMQKLKRMFLHWSP